MIASLAYGRRLVSRCWRTSWRRTGCRITSWSTRPNPNPNRSFGNAVEAALQVSCDSDPSCSKLGWSWLVCVQQAPQCSDLRYLHWVHLSALFIWSSGFLLASFARLWKYALRKPMDFFSFSSEAMIRRDAANVQLILMFAQAVLSVSDAFECLHRRVHPCRVTLFSSPTLLSNFALVLGVLFLGSMKIIETWREETRLQVGTEPVASAHLMSGWMILPSASGRAPEMTGFSCW